MRDRIHIHTSKSFRSVDTRSNSLASPSDCCFIAVTFFSADSSSIKNKIKTKNKRTIIKWYEKLRES